MEDLLKFFNKLSRDLKTLEKDMTTIINRKEGSDKDKDNDGEVKKRPLKSMRKRAPLRKNTKEIIEAQEDPDTAFVIDKT